MRDLLTAEYKTYLELWSKRAFTMTVLILHIIYAVVYIGIVYVNLDYLRIVNIAVQTCVCVYLLLRFNPYTNNATVKLEHFDVSIIFMCAWILATNLVIVEITNTQLFHSWIYTLRYGIHI